MPGDYLLNHIQIYDFIILGFCSPKNNSAFLPFGRRFVQNLKILETMKVFGFENKNPRP
jgi:hypothetical protein